MKTSELTGAALNWAVAKCEGGYNFDATGLPWDVDLSNSNDVENGAVWFKPSTDWAQGGPIIEREGIVVNIRKECGWIAGREFWYLQDKADHNLCSTGETYLIAAMRCYVELKLGDDVEIPEGLTS